MSELLLNESAVTQLQAELRGERPRKLLDTPTVQARLREIAREEGIRESAPNLTETDVARIADAVRPMNKPIHEMSPTEFKVTARSYFSQPWVSGVPLRPV